MQSDGPFNYSSVAGKIVEAAKDGPEAQALIARALREAYAEGRKAMEKDFKELMHLASVMSEVLKETPYSTRIVNIFVDWKKARGIK